MQQPQQPTDEGFYEQALQLNGRLMGQHTNDLNDAVLQLKQLLKEVRAKKLIPKMDCFQLERLEVVVLTNLACIYRKKLKFSVALLYLKAVQTIEHRNNYSDEDSGPTHSNICVVLSEMGKHEEAYKQIMLGIAKLERAAIGSTQQLSQVNLVVAYYNCATQCEYLRWYDRSVTYLEKGLQHARKMGLHQDVQIVLQLNESLQRVEKYRAKVQEKFSTFYQNQYRHRIYFKNRHILDETFVVTKGQNQTVEVQTKLPQLRRLSPFPNLFMKSRRSHSTNSSSARIQEISKISAYCPRHPSEDSHTLRSIVPAGVTLQRTVSVTNNHQKSIESSLLEYADEKKKRTNFRRNKFTRADQG